MASKKKKTETANAQSAETTSVQTPINVQAPISVQSVEVTKTQSVETPKTPRRHRYVFSNLNSFIRR